MKTRAWKNSGVADVHKEKVIVLTDINAQVENKRRNKGRDKVQRINKTPNILWKYSGENYTWIILFK